MQRYLSASKYIDFNAPEVLSVAKKLAASASSEEELVRVCFEFVRDEILHSSDYGMRQSI